MATLIKDRIDVRINREHKELIKYAAEVSGYKSVSEFIVNIVSRESKRIIEEDAKILKTIEDKRLFFNALTNPPTPNENLKSALKNYQRFFISNKDTDFK